MDKTKKRNSQFKIRDEHGVAFIWVIGIFTVLVIVGASVYQILMQDSSEVLNMKSELFLRQLTVSGIEISRAALKAEYPSATFTSVGTPAAKRTLVDYINSHAVGFELSDIYQLENVDKTGRVNVIAEITMTLTKEHREGRDWILITSKATGKNYKKALEAKLLISPTNDKVFKYLGDYVVEK